MSHRIDARVGSASIFQCQSSLLVIRIAPTAGSAHNEPTRPVPVRQRQGCHPTKRAIFLLLSSRETRALRGAARRQIKPGLNPGAALAIRQTRGAHLFDAGQPA
jgi:hypothetical protein